MIRYERNIVFAVLSLCFLAIPMGSLAQEVEQKLDSLQILIGEQTTLHLSVKANKGAAVKLPSFKPSQMLTPGIEVVEQSPVNTTQISDQQVEVSRDYCLTSFDEKVYAIPALQVKVDGKTYMGRTLALKVLTVPVDTVHLNQFYPPKDVQDNPFQWSEWSGIFWLSVLGLLILALWYYLLLRLKHNKPIIIKMRVIKRVPAHEKALREINIIKQQRSENQETQKEYYTKLTTTLREYIEKRFGFRAMEMTSGEIIEHLQKANDQKMIDELKELFRTADLVKFAKYETFLGENDVNLMNAINFIDQTKTDEVPTEERVAPQLSDQDKKSQSQRKLVKALLWICGIVVVAIVAYVIYSTYVLLS